MTFIYLLMLSLILMTHLIYYNKFTENIKNFLNFCTFESILHEFNLRVSLRFYLQGIKMIVYLIVPGVQH